MKITIDSTIINKMKNEPQLLHAFLRKRQVDSFWLDIPGTVIDEIASGSDDASAFQRANIIANISGHNTNRRWLRNTRYLESPSIIFKSEIESRGRMTEIPGMGFDTIYPDIFVGVDDFKRARRLSVEIILKDQEITQENYRACPPLG